MIAFILSSCEYNVTVTTGEAAIRITSVSGDYVYIYYTLTNTCDHTIDYYKVYFDINTSAGTITIWDNGSDVLSGTTTSDWTMENIGSASLSSVTVHSVEVKAY